MCAHTRSPSSYACVHICAVYARTYVTRTYVGTYVRGNPYEQVCIDSEYWSPRPSLLRYPTLSLCLPTPTTYPFHVLPPPFPIPRPSATPAPPPHLPTHTYTVRRLGRRRHRRRQRCGVAAPLLDRPAGSDLLQFITAIINNNQQ